MEESLPEATLLNSPIACWSCSCVLNISYGNGDGTWEGGDDVSLEVGDEVDGHSSGSL